MAILLMSGEERNNEILRAQLTRWGCRPIFTVRNAEEALHLIDQQGERIRMIISDFEVPQMECNYLLKELALKAELKNCVFVGMSSDLSKGRLMAIRMRNARIDGWVLKPFGERRLYPALSVAMRKRATFRDQVILLTENTTPEMSVIHELFKSQPGHWKRLIMAKDQKELKEALQLGEESVGGLLIDPQAYAKFPSGWLAGFAKTSIGKRIVFTCLSKNPAVLGELRKSCHFFIEATDLSHFASSSIFSLMSARLACAWELELAVSRMHLLKKVPSSRKGSYPLAKALLKIDPRSIDAHAILAETLFDLGNLRQALSHSEYALQINPCLTRANLIFLRASFQSRHPDTLKRARLATQYCSRNVAVLTEAGRALARRGDKDEAERLLKRIRDIDPKHPGIEELVNDLSRAS